MSFAKKWVVLLRISSRRLPVRVQLNLRSIQDRENWQVRNCLRFIQLFLVVTQLTRRTRQFSRVSSTSTQLCTGIAIYDSSGPQFTVLTNNLVDGNGRPGTTAYETMAFIARANAMPIGTKSVAWFGAGNEDVRPWISVGAASDSTTIPTNSTTTAGIRGSSTNHLNHTLHSRRHSDVQIGRARRT